MIKVFYSYSKKCFNKYYPTNFAIPNAAAAATRPIAVTFNAPFIGGWPVTLLLK